MAELDDEWVAVNLGGDVSGMSAAMAEADALEPTYDEAKTQSDWPQWQDTIRVELDNLKALLVLGRL